LPDWFFRGALILLLIGLPIVIATAIVQGRRRLPVAGQPSAPSAGPGVPDDADSAEAAAPAAPAPHHWLNWRNAVLGFVGAFAAWGLIVSVYMGTRALGIGPVGSLVAAGVLDERERLIVADFENNTGDPLLGQAAAEAFRIDLSQSTIVTVVDPAFVGQVLRRMQADPERELDLALAREVAIREGIKAVVAGDITRVGGGYQLAAQLVSAQDGSVLVPFRETASDSTEIIDAIDRLSGSLRERIGESLKTIRASEPLDRVSTTSLEALRKYSLAVRVIEQGDNERGIALLEEAVALDTAFAMAYRKLGVTLRNIGQERVRGMEALTKAFEHRDRLTERERYLTEGTYYWGVAGDNEAAMAAYESLLDLNPDDPWAMNNLAIIYDEARDFRRAEQLFTRAIELDSAGALYYGNAISTQVAQGEYGEADYTLDRMAGLFPGHPSVAMHATALASSQFDYETAERYVLDLREAQRASPLMQRWASFNMAQLAEVRGRLREAERHIQEAMAAAEAQGDVAVYVASAVRVAFHDLWFRGQSEAAVQRVEAVLARYPLETMTPAERPYGLLATFYALADRPARARAYLEEYDAAVEGGTILVNPQEGGDAAKGILALAEGRVDDAISELRAIDVGSCTICVLPMLGQAYDQAGVTDSVVAVYERYVTTPWLTRLDVGDWFALAAIYERLGGLYELSGDTEKAALYYGRFVELWEDADPDLQPRVEAARRALERLAEPS
ncbi:MAG: tetratricopeptide repeat protein, partial [Gemmatimonadetes bacterium]|nr:tetratricopeptide repeat protein [Gemmatimonadota bacterium]NIO30614.1 tetratricopeptide repeat protein [Gemmatimonadota bacterium]